MPADPRGDDSEAEAGAAGELDREVTPVGRVSKNLLELSTANEQNQNTRAYQAPAELLELARRQRERAKAKAATATQPPQPSLRPEADAAPPRLIGESAPPREQPTRRPGRKSEEAAESSAPSISVAPASSSDSMKYLEDGEPSSSSNETSDEAAPPVARSRPSRALSEVPEPASAPRPPKSLRELMRSASDPEAPRSLAAPSEVSHPPADSAPRSSESSTTSPSRTYYWVLVAVVFIALGFTIAKWPALERLLHH